MKILAVHYDISEQEAIKHFQDLGFTGVRDMHKDPEPINCNTARTQTYNAAKEEDDTEWYWVGNYDATLGKACRIYKFHADTMPESRG